MSSNKSQQVQLWALGSDVCLPGIDGAGFLWREAPRVPS